jgi:hypothetical protein
LRKKKGKRKSEKTEKLFVLDIYTNSEALFPIFIAILPGYAKVIGVMCFKLKEYLNSSVNFKYPGCAGISLHIAQATRYQ